MSTDRQLVDTNVLLRFLTGDPPEMAEKARRLVERADKGEVILVVLPVVLAETIYTLESFYELERKEIATTLLDFLRKQGIEPAEPDRLSNALTRCQERNAHFADAYLAAAALDMAHPIASFDRDFDKFKDVQRIEPEG